MKKDNISGKVTQNDDETGSNLEWILKEKPTLETNVWDFLLYMGWDAKRRSPLYKSATPEIKEKIDACLCKRKEETTGHQRGGESRFMNYLLNCLGDGLKYNIDQIYGATLGDVKEGIGIVGIYASTMYILKFRI